MVTTLDGTELAGKAYTKPEEILELESDEKRDSHGTHTASIAAGSTFDWAGGMAPDADICLVNNAVSDDKPLVPDSLWELYGSAIDLLGFEYIFRYADEVDKPCVISFSEGSHEDLWGEAQLYSAVLDSLVRPGRIICTAAGNQSNHLTYMHKPVGKERVATLISPSGNTTYVMLRSQGNFNIKLDFMKSSSETYLNYEVPIEDVLATEDSLLVDTVTAGALTFELIFGSYPSCYNPQQLITDVVINKISKGNLLSIKMAVGVSGEEAEVEAFQEIGLFSKQDLYPDYSDAVATHNILYPATDPHIICVGATSYRTGYRDLNGKWRNYNRGSGGDVAPYSSRGPTLAGLIKPDVLAPGTNVVAAFSSFFAEHNPGVMTEFDVARSVFNGQEYTWSNQSGTSMACPIVAGIIAQWLEAIPTLTREQIMEAFAFTCRRHNPDLSYPSNDYGYGEIDAEAGLKYLMELTDGMDAIAPLPAKKHDIFSIRRFPFCGEEPS